MEGPPSLSQMEDPPLTLNNGGPPSLSDARPPQGGAGVVRGWVPPGRGGVGPLRVRVGRGSPPWGPP